MEAGHKFREDCTTYIPIDTCDMDITENVVIESSLGQIIR